MLRKISVFIFALMFFAGIAFAGYMTSLKCNTCDFKSGTLYSHCGKLVCLEIVYCEKCKRFTSVAIEKREFKDNKWTDFIPVKPKGKKMFLGEERLVYPCPVCGSDAVIYSGPLCPRCKKGNLTSPEIEGKWD